MEYTKLYIALSHHTSIQTPSHGNRVQGLHKGIIYVHATPTSMLFKIGMKLEIDAVLYPAPPSCKIGDGQWEARLPSWKQMWTYKKATPTTLRHSHITSSIRALTYSTDVPSSLVTSHGPRCLSPWQLKFIVEVVTWCSTPPGRCLRPIRSE